MPKKEQPKELPKEQLKTASVEEDPPFIDYIRAGYPALWVRTLEPARAIKTFIEQIKTRAKKISSIAVWDPAAGLVHMNGKVSTDKDCRAAQQLLEWMHEAPQDTVLFAQNLDRLMGQDVDLEQTILNMTSSWVPDTIDPSEYKKLGIPVPWKLLGKSLVVVSHTAEIPDMLKRTFTLIEFALPGKRELLELIQSFQGDQVKLPTGDAADLVARSALGLTLPEAEDSYCLSSIRHRTIEPAAVQRLKTGAVRREGGLDIIVPRGNLVEEVGGYDLLKQYILDRRKTFGPEAEIYGVTPPRGIMLSGVAGTGKSLCATLAGNAWSVPVIKLDVGSLFGSYVGQSEERTRRVFQLAEAVAPSALWIDEIEKAFSFGGGDSGVSQRVFAFILNWMQEHTAPVTVIATCNELRVLKPELVRRFDVVYFLDLPNDRERQEIMAVHLKKVRHRATEFDLPALSRAAEGFVGDEIQKSIRDAVLAAFNDGARDMNNGDLLACLGSRIPLSRSQPEVIEEMRAWYKQGRAQPASTSDDVAHDDYGRRLRADDVVPSTSNTGSMFG